MNSLQAEGSLQPHKKNKNSVYFPSDQRFGAHSGECSENALNLKPDGAGPGFVVSLEEFI